MHAEWNNNNQYCCSDKVCYSAGIIKGSGIIVQISWSNEDRRTFGHKYSRHLPAIAAPAAAVPTPMQTRLCEWIDFCTAGL